jgi:hypothetical protein
VSQTACEALHEPESYYDDIVNTPELIVGEVQEYCIRAFRTNVVQWDNGIEEVQRLEDGCSIVLTQFCL